MIMLKLPFYFYNKPKHTSSKIPMQGKKLTRQTKINSLLQLQKQNTSLHWNQILKRTDVQNLMAILNIFIKLALLLH